MGGDGATGGRAIWDSEANSEPSQLCPGKIIGFELNVTDMDGDILDEGKNTYYRLSPGGPTGMHADFFMDVVLVGTGGVGSEVGGARGDGSRRASDRR